MAFEFKLPDIGEGVAEGEVVKWLVKEGETVREDQPIVEIMTDKATVEIASPKAGKIEKLMAAEGAVVKVGKGLVMIAEGASGAKSAPERPADSPLFTASPTPARSTAAPSTGMATAASSPSSSRVLASPATRRKAREMGIDLATMMGSGPAGRVLATDLQANAGASQAGQPMAARTMSAAAPARPSKITEFGRRKPNQPTSGEERIPLRGIRKKIAEHMQLSKRTAAHFTHVDEVDMTELVALRTSFLAANMGNGLKLTYLPFILRAICMGLKEFPALNARLDDEKGEIIVKHFYNIGFAVATASDDLVVPVIKNCDQKNILQLAQEIQTIAEKARTGKLSVEDLSGGTFTLTSMGPLGGLFATPIINYPEVSILGFHQIAQRPVVRDGQIVIRDMAHVSISLDHRVVDGAVAASFLNMFIRTLEHPGLLLFA